MKKLFKTSGSKGTSLALVVLVTGMIAALSTPVFAQSAEEQVKRNQAKRASEMAQEAREWLRTVRKENKVDEEKTLDPGISVEGPEGIEHISGAPSGGTFIVVYPSSEDEETQKDGEGSVVDHFDENGQRDWREYLDANGEPVKMDVFNTDGTRIATYVFYENGRVAQALYYECDVVKIYYFDKWDGHLLHASKFEGGRVYNITGSQVKDELAEDTTTEEVQDEDEGSTVDHPGEDGHLGSREYFDKDGKLVKMSLFDGNGNKTTTHVFYENGTLAQTLYYQGDVVKIYYFDKWDGHLLHATRIEGGRFYNITVDQLKGESVAGTTGEQVQEVKSPDRDVIPLDGEDYNFVDEIIGYFFSGPFVTTHIPARPEELPPLTDDSVVDHLQMPVGVTTGVAPFPKDTKTTGGKPEGQPQGGKPQDTDIIAPSAGDYNFIEDIVYFLGPDDLYEAFYSPSSEARGLMPDPKPLPPKGTAGPGEIESVIDHLQPIIVDGGVQAPKTTGTRRTTPQATTRGTSSDTTGKPPQRGMFDPIREFFRLILLGQLPETTRTVETTPQATTGDSPPVIGSQDPFTRSYSTTGITSTYYPELPGGAVLDASGNIVDGFQLEVTPKPQVTTGGVDSVVDQLQPYPFRGTPKPQATMGGTSSDTTGKPSPKPPEDYVAIGNQPEIKKLTEPIIEDMPPGESLGGKIGRGLLGGLAGMAGVSGRSGFEEDESELANKPKGSWTRLEGGPKGKTKIDLTAYPNDDGTGLNVGMNIKKAPGKGAPHLILLQHEDGMIIQPVQVLIFELWGKWTLTVSVWREAYRNGQLVNREHMSTTTSSWKELLGTYRAVVEGPAIWQQLGSGPFKKIRGVIAEFKIPAGFVPSKWSIITHVTGKGKDPETGKKVIKTVPFVADLSGNIQEKKLEVIKALKTRFQRSHGS